MAGERRTIVWTREEPLPEGELRVWLDDLLDDRAAPEGWIQVTTAHDACALLATGRVVELSLDHDLGDDERFGRGVDVVDFIGERQVLHGEDLWPRDGIVLHTANPEGREQMARTIVRRASELHRVRKTYTPGTKPRFTFERDA